jgi:penicillin-binding protein 2
LQHGGAITKNAALEWKLRDHGMFIGFAPVSAPRYACSCIVEHGSDGHPQVTAARDILLFTQKRDPLKLPTAYPVKAAMATHPERGG